MNNVYQTIGDKTLIFTTYKGKPRAAMIDSEDLDKVAAVEGEWKINQDNRFFLVDLDGADRKTVFLHSVIVGAFAPGQRARMVTHINGDAADNRKGNLMFVKE